MSLIVKWNWWYPEGCIRAPGHEEHTVDYLSEIAEDDGTTIAEAIIDDYLEHNPPDCESYEIEIVEPACIAGVYDVELNWTPSAFASMRKPAPARQPVGGSDA